jgi:ABC-type multidrug transport system, ATPase and permease components
VVALVGENGSGKTTLAKLLARLYAPDQGSISWDGVDIATIDGDQLRRSIAVIFQDFVQYRLTAGENVTTGRHERYDDTEAMEAAPGRQGPTASSPPCPGAIAPAWAPSSWAAATSPSASGSGWPWPGPSSATPPS